jgi:glutamate/tyrosine decarboxylase-like PLP-dependent enzyme
MNKPDWRAALEPAYEAALSFLEGLPERPVRPALGPDPMLTSIDEPLDEQGMPANEVVRALARAAEPGLNAMPSGRFFGYVIGGALPAAVAADWLTSAWDQNAGMAPPTPAAAAFEQVALRWIVELLELPATCSAALVTGAQMANTTCLAAARHRVLAAVGHDVESDGLIGAPNLSIVVSAERHDTVLRALRLLGLGAGKALAVETDARGAMRADALREALVLLKGPTIVCAQIGNVNTGAVDPMAGIADAVDELRARIGRDAVWLHADGAFGLWARASSRLRGLAAGSERADSWATDAHKWLNTPYDCGIAIVKDSEAHRRAMAVRAAYLPDPDAHAARSPMDWTPEFSRRARGFAVYAALRQLGRSGVEELIERCCAHARAFAEQLGALPGVIVLCPVELNQALVRFEDPAGGGDRARGDAHTREVVRRVQADGTCFMSETIWHGFAAMRISVSNWSTDTDDVRCSVESIARAHTLRT